MAEQARRFRCLNCNAPHLSEVHHVRNATHCYVPKGAKSYDTTVHAPAVTIELDADGYCGPCGAARKGRRR